MVTSFDNEVKTGKHSLSKSRAKFYETVSSYADSQLTMREIAKEVGCSYQCVRDILMTFDNYNQRYLRAKSENSKKQDLSKRVSKGTTHEGYFCKKTPDWYEGNKATGNKTKYTFVHVLVVCEALGWSKIPTGYCVHHIDENKHNNNISNLALMRKDDHNLLHGLCRRGVTTIPIRKYTQVGGSASLWTFSTPDEDIVCSCWQQQAG